MPNTFLALEKVFYHSFIARTPRGEFFLNKKKLEEAINIMGRFPQGQRDWKAPYIANELMREHPMSIEAAYNYMYVASLCIDRAVVVY